MNLLKIHSQITSGVIVDHIEVLEALVSVYQEGLEFMHNLYNNDENLAFLSNDMMKLGNYIPTIGLAKSLADAVLENKLSNSDEKWRKGDLADYKQSSKSSTTHQINLRGKNDNYPFYLVSKSLTTLYFDMNTKFKALQTIGSNLKFEIEKGLATYTINRKIN